MWIVNVNNTEYLKLKLYLDIHSMQQVSFLLKTHLFPLNLGQYISIQEYEGTLSKDLLKKWNGSEICSVYLFIKHEDKSIITRLYAIQWNSE